MQVAAHEAVRRECGENRVRVALVTFGQDKHVIARVGGKTGEHVGGAGHGRDGGPVVQTRFGVTHGVAGGTHRGGVPVDEGGSSHNLCGVHVCGLGAVRVGGEGDGGGPVAVFAVAAFSPHINVVWGVVDEVGDGVRGVVHHSRGA